MNNIKILEYNARSEVKDKKIFYIFKRYLKRKIKSSWVEIVDEFIRGDNFLQAIFKVRIRILLKMNLLKDSDELLLEHVKSTKILMN